MRVNLFNPIQTNPTFAVFFLLPVCTPMNWDVQILVELQCPNATLRSFLLLHHISRLTTKSSPPSGSIITKSHCLQSQITNEQSPGPPYGNPWFFLFLRSTQKSKSTTKCMGLELFLLHNVSEHFYNLLAMWCSSSSNWHRSQRMRQQRQNPTTWRILSNQSTPHS